MFKSEAPQPSGNLFSSHDVAPATFEVADRNVNLLQLIVPVRFSEGKFNTILINGADEVRMAASKCRSYIDLEVGRNSNVVAEAAE